jgi:hypothetical protein
MRGSADRRDRRPAPLGDRRRPQPSPIVAVVVVLGAPRARTAGPAFALGWIAGLLAVSAIVVLLVGSRSDPDTDDPGLNWFKIVTASLTCGAEPA